MDAESIGVVTDADDITGIQLVGDWLQVKNKNSDIHYITAVYAYACIFILISGFDIFIFIFLYNIFI